MTDLDFGLERVNTVQHDVELVIKEFEEPEVPVQWRESVALVIMIAHLLIPPPISNNLANEKRRQLVDWARDHLEGVKEGSE